MDKVVHFEIPADNVERANKFYKETFDWKITPVPQLNYTLLGTVEVDQKTCPRYPEALWRLMESSFGVNVPSLL